MVSASRRALVTILPGRRLIDRGRSLQLADEALIRLGAHGQVLDGTRATDLEAGPALDVELELVGGNDQDAVGLVALRRSDRRNRQLSSSAENPVLLFERKVNGRKVRDVGVLHEACQALETVLPLREDKDGRASAIFSRCESVSSCLRTIDVLLATPHLPPNLSESTG